MRAAVFNAHWETLGGGEQLAGGIAAALARDHDVELLVEGSFDPVVASERLGFDLTSIPQREVASGTRAFLDASADYELLVNSSFSSTHASRAVRSVYYVHFPMPHGELESWKAPLRAAVLDPYAKWVEREQGFWLREFRGNGCWTTGDARAALVVPRAMTLPFSMRLDAGSWPPGRSPHVRVEIGSTVAFDARVDPRQPVTLRTHVVGRGVDEPIAVSITSDTFVPRVELGTDDDRDLGIVVSHLHLGHRLPGLRAGEAGRLREVVHRHFVPEFLESYDEVVANSRYTAEWVERLWNRQALVVPPPVLLRSPGPKRQIILAVGRFFPPSSGHSKKQVELIHAFRVACERGLRGWEFHLVGGCKPVDRAYAEEARKAAVGLPVHFHINARGDDVAELFASASLFWHAAGLGEDSARHPDRLEHFGITVVEAMSAGVVPLVYARGGPAAIVEAAGCGSTYDTIDELATRTVDLAQSPAELERLSELATRAASDYAFDEFADRVRALVAELEIPLRRGRPA